METVTIVIITSSEPQPQQTIELQFDGKDDALRAIKALAEHIAETWGD